MIIDDPIALEDPESFKLTFKNLPPGVETGNVPESAVIINDNDGELFCSAKKRRCNLIFLPPNFIRSRCGLPDTRYSCK